MLIVSVTVVCLCVVVGHVSCVQLTDLQSGAIPSERGAVKVERRAAVKPSEGDDVAASTPDKKQVVRRVEDEEDDVPFLLYTKRNKAGPVHMPLKVAGEVDKWDKDQDVVVIVHGWKETATSLYHSAQHIKNAYLEQERPENFVLVDWTNLASPSVEYKDATKNAHHVGIILSLFIRNLVRNKLTKDFANVRIVGYNLGAHAGGVAGNRIQQEEGGKKVSRITGLDPNWEHFGEEVPEKKRLTQDDAQFVDVMHCNMGTRKGTFGTTLISGTADFFPNGGAVQNGCEHPAGGESTELCSSEACFKLFANSISGKKYKGCTCESWEDFAQDKCNSCAILMGEHTPTTAKGKYFLRTPSIS